MSEGSTVWPLARERVWLVLDTESYLYDPAAYPFLIGWLPGMFYSLTTSTCTFSLPTNFCTVRTVTRVSHQGKMQFARAYWENVDFKLAPASTSTFPKRHYVDGGRYL
jgi:hypothetical protein